MSKPIDVIAVMNSGVTYASSIYEYYKEKGRDVRFLAFYPVPITYSNFQKNKEELYFT
jgi:hypothetical protein